MTLIPTASGATLVCSNCNTAYDGHGVDLQDIVPPYGDGCEECREELEDD